MMTIQYSLSFDGCYSVVTIPAMNGKRISETPDEVFYDDEYLDTEHFSYTAGFRPYDTDTFSDIEIQKTGGDDQSARATSYYEQLTREEADYIIGEFIRVALGLDDFQLETDSEDFIDENPWFEDEEEDEDENLE